MTGRWLISLTLLVLGLAALYTATGTKQLGVLAAGLGLFVAGYITSWRRS